MPADRAQPGSPPPPPEPTVPQPPAAPPSPAPSHASTPPPPPLPPAREIVPERPRDRWAHRRGEPRVFAFLWTLFLFAATAATFLSALSTGSPSPDVMRPATRALMAVTICGITLIWPMVRLSQAPDRHPIGGCIQDLIVVLIPAQAVIWPQWFGWLGRWPITVIGAVSVLCCAWGVLVGGMLAIAQAGHARSAARDPRAHWHAGRWMAIFLLMALAGLVPVLLRSGVTLPAADPTQEPYRGAWMLSPITAIYELTRDRTWTGTSAAVVRHHWDALAITGAASVPLWLAALLRARGLKDGGGLH